MRFLALALVLTVLPHAAAAQPTTTRADGGKTLNAGSSLTREWVTIHDPSLPVDIVGTAGIHADLSFGRLGSEYKFKSKYTLAASAPISAVEVKFLTFDVFGKPMTSLVATDIVDMAAGSTKEISSEWRVFSDNDAVQLTQSIAYVANVRTADGKIRRANEAAVLAEARKMWEKFSPADLEPTPKK